jgi:hypothetical protein
VISHIYQTKLNVLSFCRLLLKKEVIQPLVPQRLPCYDFIPVTGHTFDVFLLQAGWYDGFGCIRLP